MIAAAVLGAWLGAGIVAELVEAEGPDRDGLRAAGRGRVHARCATSGCFPPAATRSACTGMKLVIAVAGNFLLGALMTLGIGLYAPCMILVSLLGMSERTAFPIMMGSCAFLMPVGSLKFIQEQGLQPARRARASRSAASPACSSPAMIVKSMDLVHRPLAGHRRRPLHGDHDAPLGAIRRRVRS